MGSKKYDILSFDPRGVQFTTPRADCFETFPRDAWELGVAARHAGLHASSGLKRHLALFRASWQPL